MKTIRDGLSRFTIRIEPEEEVGFIARVTSTGAAHHKHPLEEGYKR